MKQFIDKLIERLEEYKYSHLVEHDSERLEHCKEKEKYCEGSDCFLCVWDKAIEIVNQLAEEYSSKSSGLENDGWIPCSERLPSREEVEEWATFLVTIRVHGKYEIMDFCLFGTDGKWHVSEGKEVIAWKRQMPYQPKGE